MASGHICCTSMRKINPLWEFMRLYFLDVDVASTSKKYVAHCIVIYSDLVVLLIVC